MPSTDPVRQSTAKLARLYTHGEPDPRAVIAARRELKEIKLSRAIHEAIDSIPPLTAEQRQRIALILTGGGR